ncbi:hypothetical protein GJ496_008848 [Pomphorhynchus laevis]|nr:hypothetical protein GJ496_008848 [Pomphorhynchus laevis]
MRSLNLRALNLHVLNLISQNPRALNLHTFNLCLLNPRACNLRTLNLRALNLRALNLRALNLRALNLRALNLRALNLRALNLRALNLRALNLRALNLRALNLRALNLRALNLRALNLRALNLHTFNLCLKESSSSRHDQERERRHLGLPPKREGYLIVCSKTVFLGHLPKMINEINIKEDLERMGPIINITYIQPRGCAFVCFEHRRHAARCVEKMQKDMKIQGNTVKLCWAVNIGVKDKFDNAWDSKYGCTYIAIDENLKKLEASKIVALCEGGMLDEHGAPSDILKKVNDFKKAQIVKEEEEARSKAKAAVTTIGNIDPISGCSGLQLTTFTDKVGTMQNSNGAMTMMTGAKQHTISQISAMGAAPLPHPPLPPILMRPVNPSTNIDSSSTAAITMTPSMDRTFTNAGGLAIQSQNQQSLISHSQFGQIHFAAQNSESLQQPHAIITSPFKTIIPPPTTLGSGVVDGRNDGMPTIGHIGGMQVNFTGQVPVHNPHPVIFNQRQWVVGHLPTITARPPPFANIVDIGKAFPTEAALPNNNVAQNAWQCVQRYPSNIPPLPINTSSNNSQEHSSTGQQCDNHSSKAISDVHKRPESAENLPSKRHVSRFNRSTANPDIHQRKPTDNLPITFSSEKVATAASVSSDFVDMTLNDKNTTVSSNITANDFRDSEHVNAQKLKISQTNVDMVNNDEEDKYTCIKEYGDNLTDNTSVSSNSGTALITAATDDPSNENRKNNRKEEILQISSDCDGSNRNQNSIQDGGHQHRNSLKLPQSPLQKSLHSSQLSTVHHYTYESALEQSPLHRSLFEQQNKEMHPPQSQHQRPLISTAPPTNDYQYNYNENVAMSNINQQGIVGERDMSYFEYGRDDFGPYRPGPPQPMRPPTALSPIRQNYCWQQPQPYYQPRHRNEFSQQMNCNSQIPSTRYGQPIPPPLQYEACMRADFEPNNQYPYHQHTSRYIAPSIDTRFSYETNYHQQYNNISRGGTERYRWTPPNPNRYYNDFHRFRGVGGSIDADFSGGGTVPYPPRNGSNRSFRFNRGNQYHRHGPYPFPAHSHILTTPRSFTPATSGSPFVPTANIQYDDFNIKCTDQTPKAENQDNVGQQHIQTTSITEDHDGDNNTKCRRNDSATIHEANQNEYFTQQQHSDSSLPVCPSSTNQDMGNQNSDNEYHSVLYDDLEAKVLPTSSPSPKAPRCSPSIITTADTAAANRDNDCSNEKMCEARQQSCGSLETRLDVSSAEQHEQPADKCQENFEIRLPNNDDHTKQETGPATTTMI